MYRLVANGSYARVKHCHLLQSSEAHLLWHWRIDIVTFQNRVLCTQHSRGFVRAHEAMQRTASVFPIDGRHLRYQQQLIQWFQYAATGHTRCNGFRSCKRRKGDLNCRVDLVWPCTNRAHLCRQRQRVWIDTTLKQRKVESGQQYQNTDRLSYCNTHLSESQAPTR